MKPNDWYADSGASAPIVNQYDISVEFSESISNEVIVANNNSLQVADCFESGTRFVTSKAKEENNILWRRRMGHINFESLKKLKYVSAEDATVNSEHGYVRARLSQSIEGFSKTTGQISELASIVKNLAETIRVQSTSSPSSLAQPGTNAVSCIIGGLLDENIMTIARAGNYQNSEELFEFLKNCENSKKIENPHDRKGGTKRKYEDKPKYDNEREYTKKRTEYQHKLGVECYRCGEKGHFKLRCTKPSPWCRNCKNSGHETDKCSKQLKKNVKVPC
ncbi:hypothetical protein CBL_20966 [Carabus blaptoides fortunei]